MIDFIAASTVGVVGLGAWGVYLSVQLGKKSEELRDLGEAYQRLLSEKDDLADWKYATTRKEAALLKSSRQPTHTRVFSVFGQSSPCNCSSFEVKHD